MSGCIVAAAMAIGMEDYASEIYQSESEPFLVEEDSKKKPIIVGRPVEEGAPEPPEIKEIVRTTNVEKPVGEAAIESRGPPPPPQEGFEEKPRIKKPPKTSKAKPPEKAEEKVQSRPTEKVEKPQTRPAEKTSTSFSDDVWQIAAIAGLGVIILFVIRRFRV